MTTSLRRIGVIAALLLTLGVAGAMPASATAQVTAGGSRHSLMCPLTKGCSPHGPFQPLPLTVTP
jgi:hypothetical protein